MSCLCVHVCTHTLTEMYLPNVFFLFNFSSIMMGFVHGVGFIQLAE